MPVEVLVRGEYGGQGSVWVHGEQGANTNIYVRDERLRIFPASFFSVWYYFFLGEVTARGGVCGTWGLWCFGVLVLGGLPLPIARLQQLRLVVYDI